MYCSGCGKQIPEDYSGPICPSCGATLAPAAPEAPAPPGIPWEERDRLGFFSALLANLRGCLFDPDGFFRSMPKRENVGSALFYAILLGWIGGLGGVVWDVAFQGSRQEILKAFGFPQMENALSGPMRGVAYTVAAILLPVALLLGIFVVSAVLHASLWILGGAKEGFATTLRTHCYASGSTALFQWIPLCGGLVGLVWWLVLQIYGLSRSHEISGGKAALAVLLPLALCCLMILALVILFASFFLALFKGMSV
ncbi:MAG TPA: YIP1 family protein [Candidatus Polarisedimenticolia bacterium]|nr:YIP1 family protein [Candidatus Polarisedimenticolia bacterium]